MPAIRAPSSIGPDSRVSRPTRMRAPAPLPPSTAAAARPARSANSGVRSTLATPLMPSVPNHFLVNPNLRERRHPGRRYGHVTRQHLYAVARPWSGGPGRDAHDHVIRRATEFSQLRRPELYLAEADILVPEPQDEPPAGRALGTGRALSIALEHLRPQEHGVTPAIGQGAVLK